MAPATTATMRFVVLPWKAVSPVVLSTSPALMAGRAVADGLRRAQRRGESARSLDWVMKLEEEARVFGKTKEEAKRLSDEYRALKSPGTRGFSLARTPHCSASTSPGRSWRRRRS